MENIVDWIEHLKHPLVLAGFVWSLKTDPIVKDGTKWFRQRLLAKNYIGTVKTRIQKPKM